MTLKHIILGIVLLGCFLCASCRKGAGSTEEAVKRLTGSSNWHIDEISVNDKITFSNGEMKPQFGEVEFERYMETVSFEKNGKFMGLFKGQAMPMTLKWWVNSPDILVGSTDTTSQAGFWTISLNNVTENSFVMKTRSTAYDFPRETKIALKFKNKP
jgi:hypothetical protein